MTKTSTMTHEAISTALCENAPLSDDQRAALLTLIARDKQEQTERDTLVDRLKAEAKELKAFLRSRDAGIVERDKQLNQFRVLCAYQAAELERLRAQVAHLVDDLTEEVAGEEEFTYYRLRDGKDVLFSNMVGACARLLAAPAQQADRFQAGYEAAINDAKTAQRAEFPVVSRWTGAADQAGPKARVWVQFVEDGAEVEFAPAAPSPTVGERCRYCDGTGDVHRADGEWLGECNQCPEAITHAFKNFHRLLCERFDYTHDEKDWRRDQLSLIEHIAKLARPAAQAEPVARVTEFVGAIRIEAECLPHSGTPMKIGDMLYAAPQPAAQGTGAVPPTDDLDAWKCDDCEGDGWTWLVTGGHEPRDQVRFKSHCYGCDGLGWCGPDAKTAAAKEQQP